MKEAEVAKVTDLQDGQMYHFFFQKK